MRITRSTLTRTAVTATALAAGALALPAAAQAVAVPATVSACGNHAIAISATAPQGATGHGNLLLRFHNTSGSTCTITGYPGVDALNYYKHVITSAKRTATGFSGGSRKGVQTIVVHPGSYASADLEWTNFNTKTGGGCLTSHYIDATTANTTRVVRLTRAVSVCGLQIHPTVAGITGNS